MRVFLARVSWNIFQFLSSHQIKIPGPLEELSVNIELVLSVTVHQKIYKGVNEFYFRSVKNWAHRPI